MGYQSELGIVGLNRVGYKLAANACALETRVVAYSLTGVDPFLKTKGVVPVVSPVTLLHHLPSPRILFLFVSSIRLLGRLMDGLLPFLGAGDLIVDCCPKDAQVVDICRRKLWLQGAYHLDAGVLDSPEGQLFLLGGDDRSVSALKKKNRKLFQEKNCLHVGPYGAGHLAKMAHEEVASQMEIVVKQAVDSLKQRSADVNVSSVLKAWNRIPSRLCWGRPRHVR